MHKLIGSRGSPFGALSEEAMEKSTGDPLLDRVSIVMAEHKHQVRVRETLLKMSQLLAGPGVQVRLHLGLQIDIGEMGPREMEAYLLEDRPDLAEDLNGPDGAAMKALFHAQIAEAIKAGHNRRQEHLQVDFEVPATLARSLVKVADQAAPTPDPSKASAALRALADRVESETPST